MGAASARFEYEIRRRGTEIADELLVTGHTLHACITTDGRVVRIPPEMREALGARPR